MRQPVGLHSFSPHVGEEFALVSLRDAGETLQLVEAKPLPGGSVAREAPFALLFRASAAADLWQGMATISNDAAGTLELFLVPVREDETGRYFEAVFN